MPRAPETRPKRENKRPSPSEDAGDRRPDPPPPWKKSGNRTGEEFFRGIAYSAQEGIITIDAEAIIDFVNPKIADMLGYAKEAMIGRPLADFMDEEGQRILAINLDRRRQGISDQFDFKFVRQDGSDLWVYTSTNPLTDANGTYIGALGMFTDITRRREAERLLAWEKKALEQIVSSAPLPELLEQLMLGLEQHLSGAICSILLLEEDGLHLRHGAAPSLPEAYNRQVDGLPIGPQQGSCGTAVHAGRQIIVADIASDPLWVDFRQMALEHGLRACWSTPIETPEGGILGTFAIYHREPRVPSSRELEVVERARHVAYLALERKRAETTLQVANENLRLSNENLERRVLERTARLRKLSSQLNQVEERERLRVADSLHEGLLQLLATVALGLDGLGQYLTPGAPTDCLSSLRATLLEAMAMGRDLTHDLHPPALHSADLGHALYWLARRHQERHQLTVQLKVASKFDLPDRELRILLFRGANELLTNVGKHSQVGQAQMTLATQAKKSVCLTVSDDGIGFHATEVWGGDRGFGLFSLRERVEALGGNLSVESAPDCGTRVSILVPQQRKTSPRVTRAD